MKWLSSSVWISCLLVMMRGLQGGERQEPEYESISQLVASLSHDKFAVREEATRKLTERGADAVRELESIAGGLDLEARARIRYIIQRIESTTGRADGLYIGKVNEAQYCVIRLWSDGAAGVANVYADRSEEDTAKAVAKWLTPDRERVAVKRGGRGILEIRVNLETHAVLYNGAFVPRGIVLSIGKEHSQAKRDAALQFVKVDD